MGVDLQRFGATTGYWPAYHHLVGATLAALGFGVLELVLRSYFGAPHCWQICRLLAADP
jgi:hypothetical protein